MAKPRSKLVKSDPGPALRWLRELEANGKRDDDIASVAGVSRSSLQRLRSPGRKWVDEAIARRILAVRLDDPGLQPRRVDPEPARLWIEYLVQGRLTVQNIARAANTSTAELYQIRRRARPSISKAVSERILSVRVQDKVVQAVRKIEHGTPECYSRGCRKPECRKARMDEQRDYREQLKDGQGKRTVPAGPVQDRLKQFRAAGASVAAIADATGVKKETLESLFVPGLRKSVRAETANKILAVQVDDLVLGKYEPSSGLVPLIQDMMLRQWSRGMIGNGAGLNGKTVHNIVSGRLEQVERSTAQKLRELFERQAGAIGPSVRAGQFARRQGYVPFGQWQELPVWRAAPELASNVTVVSTRSRQVLLALEYRLEHRIRYWLAEQRLAEPWLELAEGERRIIQARFKLGSIVHDNSLESAPVFANRIGLPVSFVRLILRANLGKLLADWRTSVDGYERELEVYMTHPGLRNL